MLSYVAVGRCGLAGVALDCCVLVVTIGNLLRVRRSGQTVAHSCCCCCKCGFGCSGMRFRLHCRVRKGVGLAVGRMAAEDYCSPAVDSDVSAVGIHTADVYQGPVLEPVVVDSGLDTEVVARGSYNSLVLALMVEVPKDHNMPRSVLDRVGLGEKLVQVYFLVPVPGRTYYHAFDRRLETLGQLRV
jgi:hypothetical protein